MIVFRPQFVQGTQYFFAVTVRALMSVSCIWLRHSFHLQRCCSERWPSLRPLSAVSEMVETMPLVRLPLAVITVGALLIIAIFNFVSNCISFSLLILFNIVTITDSFLKWLVLGPTFWWVMPHYLFLTLHWCIERQFCVECGLGCSREKRSQAVCRI